MRDAA